MTVTARTRYRWRGRIRAQVQEEIKLLGRLLDYNTKHPPPTGFTPFLSDTSVASMVALGTVFELLVAERVAV